MNDFLKKIKRDQKYYYVFAEPHFKALMGAPYRIDEVSKYIEQKKAEKIIDFSKVLDLGTKAAFDIVKNFYDANHSEIFHKKVSYAFEQSIFTKDFSSLQLISFVINLKFSPIYFNGIKLIIKKILNNKKNTYEYHFHQTLLEFILDIYIQHPSEGLESFWGKIARKEFAVNGLITSLNQKAILALGAIGTDLAKKELILCAKSQSVEIANEAKEELYYLDSSN